MKTINWGIMGTGRIARSFASALGSVETARACAVASRTPDKAAQFAEKFAFAKSYGSYYSLVTDPDIDIIYVATPMSCHYENAKLCLENGKNVLCEKTVTVTPEEARELVALARSKKLFFMEAMWTKFMPAYITAKQWATDGSIGQIQLVKAEFCNNLPFDAGDRLFRRDLGGGALLDLGVYPISLALDFLGHTPESVTSFARFGKTNVDYDASFLFKYKNAYAALSTGFDMYSINSADIVGTNGRVTLGDWFFTSTRVKMFDGNGKLVRDISSPHKHNGYEYEIMECNRALVQGETESKIHSLDDMMATMDIMDECRRQWNEKGCKV